MPQRRSTDEVGRSPAQVVGEQYKGEGEPVADDVQHAAAPTNAGGEQAGCDVEQYHLAVEREALGRRAEDDDERPDCDRDPAHDREPSSLGRRDGLVGDRRRNWRIVNRGHSEDPS